MVNKTNQLVSVIVPVYNVANYLNQCLDSIINQTYRNIEVIVIDDGSIDYSGAICDDYSKKDSRFLVLHIENKGLANARNLGIEKARGSYLLYVDSDDWIELDTIEIMMDSILKYQVDVVAAQHFVEYIGKKEVFNHRGKRFGHVVCGADIPSSYLEGMFGVQVWNKLYNTKCFENTRFPTGRNSEDVATTWRLLKDLADANGRIVEIPDCLFHFRQRKSSIGHTDSLSNIEDHWMAFLERYEGMKEYGKQFLPSCYIAIGRMWTNYCRFSKQDKIKAKKVIHEMQLFSQKHYREVMKGDYTKHAKLVCVASQFKALPVMWFCFFVGVIQKKKLSHGKKCYE